MSVATVGSGGGNAIIDKARFGSFQFGVTGLCFLIAMVDGFDTQSIAFVAPVIAKDWGLSVAAFGPIFSAGLIGLTLGAFLLSPIADRFGRKPIILASVAIIGLFCLLTARAGSMEVLLIYRFITGIGLGAALPNIIALTNEYSPDRLRATLVMVMYCGFPLGSTLGGLISTWLIAAYGWHSVFVCGGLLPMLLLPLLAWRQPESVRFLVAHNAPESRIKPIVERIDPAASVSAFVQNMKSERQSTAVKGFAAFHLFREGRTPLTLLLWLAFFNYLMGMYFLISWLPTLLTDAGLPLSLGILSTSVLNLGGVTGALILSWLIDRKKHSPFIVLGLAFAVSSAFVVLVAAGAENLLLLFVGALFVGFGVSGAGIGSNALAANSYPTAIRATGVGWGPGSRPARRCRGAADRRIPGRQPMDAAAYHSGGGVPDTAHRLGDLCRWPVSPQAGELKKHRRRRWQSTVAALSLQEPL